MNREGALSVVVAVLCVAALGASASTLDSAVSTDPDDVIDISWKDIPIGEEEGESLKDEIEKNERSSSGYPSQVQTSSPEDRGQAGSEADPDRTEQRPAGGSKSGTSVQPATKSVVDQLLSLLRQLLPYLLMALLVVAVIGLLYRYRDRLWALALVAAGVLGGLVPGRSDGGAGGAGSVRYDVEPEHEVDRAWYAMIDRLGLRPPTSKTPGECARMAREAGMDESAVETLTRTFQEVRYGGRPVTDEHRRQASQSMQQLGLGGAT